jgi:TrmH family RNA methyltransferase
VRLPGLHGDLCRARSHRRPRLSRSDPRLITSQSNPVIRLIRSLRDRKARYQERAFLVEGERAVADALASGATPLIVAVREGWQPTYQAFFDTMVQIPTETLRVVRASLFRDLSDTVTPSGIIAVFPFPQLKLPDRTELIVIADGLRDPGNLGSLIRSAAGAGATSVFTTPETVDPYNPKAVRAGMGGHFRISVQPYESQRAEDLKARCPLRVLAMAGGYSPPEAVDWTGPALLIVGGEAFGARGTALDLVNERVSIPLEAGMDSLNAAVAGAVVLFEASRQRRSRVDLSKTGDIRHLSY